MPPTDPTRDSGHPLAPKEPGAPAADDHAPMGPPSDETIRRGYETDTYDAKSVISVPLLVVLFFVLAFGTVSIIFYFIAYPPGDPRAHPGAAERNKRPLNERMAGIGRTKEGDQPRLEPLKQRSGGDLARAITRPELPDGNSPEIHPEDLRVTKERFPALYQSGGGKYSVDAVMGLNDEKALKALFPSSGPPLSPAASQHVPTASNAGRGADESLVIIPPTPKIPAPKPEDKKPDPKPGDKK